MNPAMANLLGRFDAAGDPGDLDRIYQLLAKIDEQDRFDKERGVRGGTPLDKLREMLPTDVALPEGYINNLPAGVGGHPVVDPDSVPDPGMSYPGVNPEDALEHRRLFPKAIPGTAGPASSFSPSQSRMMGKPPETLKEVLLQDSDQVGSLGLGPDSPEGRVRPEGIGPETLEDIFRLPISSTRNPDDIGLAVEPTRGEMVEVSKGAGGYPYIKSHKEKLNDIAQEVEDQFDDILDTDSAAHKAALRENKAAAMQKPRNRAGMAASWNRVNGIIKDIEREGGQVPAGLVKDRDRYASFLREHPDTRALLESGGTVGDIDRLRRRSRLDTARKRGNLYASLADPDIKAARDKIMKDGDDIRYRPGSDDGYNPETGVRVDLKSKRRRQPEKHNVLMAKAGQAKAMERLKKAGKGPEVRAAERKEAMENRSTREAMKRQAYNAGVRGEPMPEAEFAGRYEQVGLRRLMRDQYEKGRRKRDANERRKPWQQRYLEQRAKDDAGKSSSGSGLTPDASEVPLNT